MLTKRSVLAFFSLSRWFDHTGREGIYRVLFTQSVLFLLFWLASFLAPIQHQFFYIDYLYLPFLFRIHWLVGAIATIPMVLFNFYFSMDSTNGLSLVALVGLIREIPDAGSWAYQLALFTIALFAGIVWFVARQYQKVSLKAAGVLLCILAIAYYPVKKISPKWPILSIGLTSPILHWVLFKDAFFFERLNPRHMIFSPLKEPSLLEKSIDGSPQVLSILFESYGINKLRPQINDYFVKKLRDALPNRRIDTSVLAYSGSTVNGELRELCSVKTEGVMLDSVPKMYLCIPEKLRQEGYVTAAFHNNKAGFYDRAQWYPNIGFSTFIDRTEMLNKGYLPSSYAFGGISDWDMAKEIAGWLKTHPRIFAHWITLDSHNPYNKALANKVVDCQALQIKDEMECNYVNQLDSTFSAILFIAKAHPHVKMVISGDHAPHFESLEQPLVGKRLNASFDHQHVPGLVIFPAIK